MKHVLPLRRGRWEQNKEALLCPEAITGEVAESGDVADGDADLVGLPAKRRFVRPSVRNVELDPETRTGRAEIYDLPVFSLPVQEKKYGPDGHPSSLRVAAGARYVVEEEIPGLRTDFQ